MHLTWFQQFLFIVAFLCAIWLFYSTVKNMPMFSSVSEGFRGGLMITDHHRADINIGSCTIKAAYNSAMTPGGKMVVGGPNEQKGLYEVIGKGCRFLDFAVFNDNDKVAIGYHTGGDFLNEESLNDPMIPIHDILNVIQTCAFTGPAPNPNDPLFLQFRMHTTNKTIFDNLHQVIVDKFKDKLYSGDISGDTTIATTPETTSETTQETSLKNKIVIIIVTSTANEASTNPNINKVKMEEICKSSEFYNVDSETKTYVLHTHLTNEDEYMHQKPYEVVKQPTENNPTIFTVKMPELNDPTNEYANAHFERINVIQPMKFYVIDNPLVEYEEYFNNQGTAYITK
jgi:hypothetical protein